MKASLKRRKVLMAVGYSIIEFKKDYILADILHTAEMKCMRKKIPLHSSCGRKT